MRKYVRWSCRRLLELLELIILISAILAQRLDPDRLSCVLGRGRESSGKLYVAPVDVSAWWTDDEVSAYRDSQRPLTVLTVEQGGQRWSGVRETAEVAQEGEEGGWAMYVARLD